MAIEFYRAKTQISEVAVRITTNSDRIEQARARLEQAVSDLTAMATDYATLVTEIDAMVAANPSDPVWQDLKAEKDKLVQEFNALKATATGKLTAINAA